ncbi:MAG: EI24 domain-containing protein, partial [Lentisphaeria bacterium]
MEKFSGFYGISVYSESLAFLIKRPKLIIYYIYSILLSMVIFVGGFIGSWHIIHNLAIKLLLFFNIENYEGWIKNTISLFTYLGFIIIFYFLFMSVLNLVSMPFMDFLSASIEREVSGKNSEAPLWDSVKHGIISSFLIMLRQMLIMTIALPLIFIPVVGSIIYFIINSWYLAYAYLDLPMARRAWNFKEKGKFLKDCAL